MQTVNVIAALPPWAAALVWILAIVGAAVFVYRRITGAGRADPIPAADPEEPGPDETGIGVGSPTPSAFFVEPTPDRPGIPLAGDPSEPPASPAMPEAPPTPPVASSSTRAGYFAPGGSTSAQGVTSTGSTADGERRLTVAEALRGITMPCGLSPVIDGSVSIPNPFRVVFLTTTADAATVGSSLGDELEHLGYRLSTTTVTEVLARKPGVDLRVVLYPSPAKATRGLDQLFPVAPPGSVGVEFST